MAAKTTPLHAVPVNRRRRFRHKVRTPAYAGLLGESQTVALDLHAISNISEEGIAIELNFSPEAGRRFELQLELAESSGPINTSAEVIWCEASGRCGLRFADVSPSGLFRLRG